MLNVRLPVPRFVSAGELFVGAGSVSALKALNASRAALIVSPSLLAQQAAAARLRESIGAIEVDVLEAPRGEPRLKTVLSTLERIEAFQPDWIVAVGGGSVLDAAKLMWVFYEHPDIDLELISRPFALPYLRGRARFAAVPTTCGTGTEVSSSALFLDEDSGCKSAVVSHELLPDVAVLDPKLLVETPRVAVASSGLDALAHAVEGYVSRFQNPLIDVQAEKAVAVLVESLKATFDHPEDLDVRLRVMNAALMAGWVQNLKVPGVGHAVAHQMGRFDVPHGVACGALLGPSIIVNSQEPAARARYARLAQSLGLKDEHALVERIQLLRQHLKMAEPLSHWVEGGLEILRDNRAVIIQGACEDLCARANPCSLTSEIVEQVLEAAG